MNVFKVHIEYKTMNLIIYEALLSFGVCLRCSFLGLHMLGYLDFGLILLVSRVDKCGNNSVAGRDSHNCTVDCSIDVRHVALV